MNTAHARRPDLLFCLHSHFNPHTLTLTLPSPSPRFRSPGASLPPIKPSLLCLRLSLPLTLSPLHHTTTPSPGYDLVARTTTSLLPNCQKTADILLRVRTLERLPLSVAPSPPILSHTHTPSSLFNINNIQNDSEHH